MFSFAHPTQCGVSTAAADGRQAMKTMTGANREADRMKTLGGRTQGEIGRGLLGHGRRPPKMTQIRRSRRSTLEPGAAIGHACRIEPCVFWRCFMLRLIATVFVLLAAQ